MSRILAVEVDDRADELAALLRQQEFTVHRDGATGTRQLEIELPENSRVDARVVFSGRLDPDAKRLTLSTNEGEGGGSGRYDTLPLFRLALDLGGG